MPPPPSDFCAIDFGTSKSAVALPHGDGVRLVELEAGFTTMPTAVFYAIDALHGRADPVAHHGRAALSAYVDGLEGRLMRSMKSVLGSPLLEQGTDIGGGRAIRYLDVIAGYLHHLKQRAAAAAVQALRSQDQQLTDLKSRLARSERELVSLRDQAAKETATLETIEQVIAQREVIEAGWRDLQAARAAETDWNERLRLHGALREKLNQAQRAIDQERAELAGEQRRIALHFDVDVVLDGQRDDVGGREVEIPGADQGLKSGGIGKIDFGHTAGTVWIGQPAHAAFA